MTMRRPLPHLVALALGVGAAALVACGTSTKGGIPAASAGELRSQIEDVRQAVDAGRCDALDGQLRQVDDSVQSLPATVDRRLRSSLRDAADRLRREAGDECDDGESTTPTTTEPVVTQTQTEPLPTTTATTQTTTTPEQTTTAAPPPPPPPPPVTTQPPPEEPPPAEPPPTEPPAPPATPGGGATPGNGNGTSP
jgi:outer membrane biosynthesis protein TonB